MDSFRTCYQFIFHTMSMHAKYLTYIPIPPEDASFRTTEKFLIKAHLLLMVIPLIIDATMSMVLSVAPAGRV